MFCNCCRDLLGVMGNVIGSLSKQGSATRNLLNTSSDNSSYGDLQNVSILGPRKKE